MYKANLKTESTYKQVLTYEAKHTFQWSRGTATCSCGWWTLWGASLESAKRSHSFHRNNMLRIEGYGLSDMKKRPIKKAERKLRLMGKAEAIVDKKEN